MLEVNWLWMIVTEVVVWGYGIDCFYLGRICDWLGGIVLYELMGSAVGGLIRGMGDWVIGWLSMSLLGYVIDPWGGVSVGCVMFLGVGCWCSLCNCLVECCVVIGSWLWVLWWVGLGLDSGSVWGYEILGMVVRVLVFWSVGIWWVMIWFE